MSIKNLNTGKIQIIAATALTLFFSVAQSDQSGLSRSGTYNLHQINQGIDQDLGNNFAGTDERVGVDGSFARVALSTTGELGDVSVIQMQSADSTRLHFNFIDGDETGNALSATLTVKGKLNVIEDEEWTASAYDGTTENVDGSFSAADYSLSFNLPTGQVVLENDVLSILNASGFSQIDLAENGADIRMSEHFAPVLGKAVFGLGLSRLSIALEESLAASFLGSADPLEGQSDKGDKSYTEGGWACAGAFAGLAAANVALAAAIAATYATLGAMAAAIAAAVSLVGAAMAMVDTYCIQM